MVCERVYAEPYRRDNDVHILTLFPEEGHLCFNELLGHHLCVASGATAFFFDLDLNEFRAKRLDLFASC